MHPVVQLLKLETAKCAAVNEGPGISNVLEHMLEGILGEKLKKKLIF